MYCTKQKKHNTDPMRKIAVRSLIISSVSLAVAVIALVIRLLNP